MIGQVVRFWQEYDYVKKVYESGELGKLMSGKLSRMSGVPKWSWDGWLQDKNRSGLVPFDLHIHDADFMVYAFGAPKNAIVHRANDAMQDCFNVTYEYDGFFINAEAPNAKHTPPKLLTQSTRYPRFNPPSAPNSCRPWKPSSSQTKKK